MTRKHLAQGVGAVALIAVGVVAGVAWTERPSRGRPAGGGGISRGPEAVPASREAAKSDESVEVENGYTDVLKQVYDAAVGIERAVGTPAR